MEQTISTIITTAALILSVYFYIKSRKIKNISFSFTNNVIIDSEKIKFEKLKINYEDDVLKSLNITIFTIENIGNQVIEFEDIDENDKLRICLLNNHKIFDYSIIDRSKKTIDIGKVNPDSLLIDFKFLNAGDFIKIQILHDGATDDDIKLEGRIRGINSFQSKIKKYNINKSTKNWFFKPEYAIYSTIMLLFLFVYITLNDYWDEDEAIWLTCSLPISYIAIYLFVKSYQYLSSRRKNKRLRNSK